MAFDFASPWWGLGLFLLPLLWLWEPRSNRRSAGALLGRARLLRAAVLVLLLAALARMEGLRAVDSLCLVLAVDMSDSVGAVERETRLQELGRQAQERMGPRDRLAVVAFGREARVEGPVGPVRPLAEPVVRVDPSATNVAAALSLAAALFPEGMSRRILLLGDGVETAGDGRSAAEAAGRQGIPIDTMACGTSGRRDLRVERLVVPPQVREGEPYSVKAVMAANYDGRGKVSLLCNGRLLGSADYEFRRDEQRVLSFPQRSPGRGHFSYELIAESASEDGTVANNQAEAFLRAEGRPRILVVRPSGASPSALSALMAGSDIEVQRVDPDGLPARAMDLAAYGAVCFDDVPASAVSRRQMETLALWVREGAGGLAMFGGENSFGAGGWHRSPVADCLPVSMEVKRDRNTPDVGVVAVIDKSGSMAYSERGRQKIDLANEGCCKVLELLKGRDRFGVLGCDTMPKWVLPLKMVGDRGEAMARHVRTLRAGGGGIYTHTALVEAYRKLKAEQLQLRHVILFSDTADTEQAVARDGQHVFDLAEHMVADGITLSTVGIGHQMDKDLPLLRGLAHHGKGRFYFTDDMFSIPQIFAQEAMLSLRRVVIKEEFQPRIVGSSPLLSGIATMPTLHGYVATTGRPAVTMDLLTHRDDPLLAHGRCGLGRGLAFTSDLAGPWTRDWASDPGFARLVRQGMRWLVGPAEEPFFTVRERFTDEGLVVVADAVSAEGDFMNFVEADLRCLGPDGKTFEAPFRQQGPGRYEAFVPVKSSGVHLLRIRRSHDGVVLGSQVHGAVRSYSEEYRGLDGNRALLRSLAESTGGRFLTGELAEAFRRPEDPERRRSPLWDRLLLLALVLWLVDVAHRRLAWSALFDRLRSWRALPASPGEGGGYDRLRTAKASLAIHRRAPDAETPLPNSPKDRTAMGPSPREASIPLSPEPSPAEKEPMPPEEGYTSRLLRAKRALRKGPKDEG